jgi:hypothetical protein
MYNNIFKIINPTPPRYKQYRTIKFTNSFSNIKGTLMLFFLMLVGACVWGQVPFVDNGCWLGESSCTVCSQELCEVCLELDNGTYHKEGVYKVPVLYNASIPPSSNTITATHTELGNNVPRTANYTCNNGIYTDDDYWITVDWRTPGYDRLWQDYYGPFNVWKESRSIWVPIATADPAKNPSDFYIQNVVDCPSPATKFRIVRLNPTNYIKRYNTTIEECDANLIVTPNGEHWSSGWTNSGYAGNNFGTLLYNRTPSANGGYQAGNCGMNFKSDHYYKVTYSVENACTSNSTTIKRLYLPPAINNITVTSNTNNTCAGQSFVLLASSNSSNDTYQWDNNMHTIQGNNTNASLFVSNAPATPLTYTVTVTNSIGCEFTGSKQVVGLPLPSATVANPYVEICYGGNTTIGLANTAGNTYLWNNGVSTAQTTVTTDGNYTVTVTGSNGCTATNTVSVGTSVIGFPEISVSSPPPIRCFGTPHTFTVSEVNQEQVDYTWSNGSTNASITVNPNETTTYYVTASNPCGSTVSSVTMGVVSPVNLQISTPNTSICIGQSPNLVASGGFTYTWQHNGVHLPAITVTPTQTTTYTVSTTGQCGDATSTSITIVVESPPNVTIAGPTSKCDLSPTVLEAQGNGVTYNWSNGAQNAINTVYFGGIYTVTASSNIGCSTSTSISVIATAPPVLTLSLSSSSTNYKSINGRCVNTFPNVYIYNLDDLTSTNTYEIEASNLSTSYQVPLPYPINVINPPYYTVTVTNSNGCSATASIQPVAGCCLNAFESIGTTGQITYSSDLVDTYFDADPSTDNYTVKANANTNWVIQGTLVITDKLFFNRPTTWKMCKGAKIILTEETVLDFSSTGSIAGISDAWQGIEILTDATLNIKSTDFTIRDAYRSIEMYGASHVTLHSTGSNSNAYDVKFVNNGLAIYAKGLTKYYFKPNLTVPTNLTNDDATNLVPLSLIDKCYLSLDRVLFLNDGTPFLSGSSNLSGGGLSTSFANIPELDYLGEYSIKNAKFEHLNFGIILEGANPNLREKITLGNNIIFDNIHTWINHNTIASFIITSSVVGSLYTELNVGGNPNRTIPFTTHFYNCDNGIDIESGTIRGVEMLAADNNDSGIKIEVGATPQSPISSIRIQGTILIKDNNIHTNHIGIDFDVSRSLASNFVEIANNTIEAGLMPSPSATLSNYGIYMFADAGEPMDYRIHHNTIHLVQGADAIHLLSMNGYTTGKIDHNIITTGASAKQGIAFEYSGNQIITDNTITGVANFTAATTGIFGDIKNSKITCNTTNNYYTGIDLNSDCSGTSLQTNHLQTHRTGLHYGYGLTLPRQINTGNMFENPPYTAGSAVNAGGWGTGGLQGIIETDASNSVFFPAGQKYENATQLLISGNWFQNTTAVPPTQLNACTQRITKWTEWETIAEIAKGEIVSNDFEQGIQWAAQKKICELAIKQPDTLIAYPFLRDIADSLAQKPIMAQTFLEEKGYGITALAEQHKMQLEGVAVQIRNLKDSMNVFAEANDTLSLVNWEPLLSIKWQQYEALAATLDALLSEKIDSLRLLSNRVAATYVQEINEKVVTNLYWQYLGRGNTNLRSSDKSLLQGIAVQCPFTGGKAVYQARYMMATLGLGNYFDDRTSCAADGYTLRVKGKDNKINTNTADIRIYPNPASTEISIINNTESDNISITLIDVTGREVLSQNSINKASILSVSMLCNGIYFCRITNAEGNILQTSKLNIIHP